MKNPNSEYPSFRTFFLGSFNTVMIELKKIGISWMISCAACFRISKSSSRKKAWFRATCSENRRRNGDRVLRFVMPRVK